VTAYRPLHASDVEVGEPQPSLLTPVASFFRRAIAAVRRRLAVPAARPAGAATTLLTPPDGQPVLRDRMLSEVRREHDGLRERPRPTHYDRRDGEIVVTTQNKVVILPSDPYAQCPWPPAARPACAAPPEPVRADDTRCDLRIARPYAPMPVYGQAPVARVQEAERLAQGLIA
jgi:hypothetical protein